MRALVFLAAVTAAAGAFAFQPIPKESAKALKVTRGRPFKDGAVFVNGKYIEPPYVVERWGTGIRINSQQVTEQLIDWNEFLKTQSGVKVVSGGEAPPASAPVPEPVAESAAEDDSASSLDDLFDDDPKPAKASAKPAASRRSERPKAEVARRPVYSLEGDFVPNEATKAMVGRLNASRTEIDRILRSGGAIFFGNGYSRVDIDKRAFREMLEVLPELLQNSSDVQAFCVAVREAKLGYLNEVLRWDLFRNRVDYRKLKELRLRLRKDEQWEKTLQEVSKPLL